MRSAGGGGGATESESLGDKAVLTLCTQLQCLQTTTQYWQRQGTRYPRSLQGIATVSLLHKVPKQQQPKRSQQQGQPHVGSRLGSVFSLPLSLFFFSPFRFRFRRVVVAAVAFAAQLRAISGRFGAELPPRTQ